MQAAFAGVIGTLFLVLIGLGAWGCPQYNVWQQGLAGQADLERAKQDRQIAIEEANARLASAEKLGEAKFVEAQGWAKAEVERAKGVAEANKIIGNSLQGNDAYLRYLWIQSLESGDGEVIYVPTEANLPILEATRQVR